MKNTGTKRIQTNDAASKTTDKTATAQAEVKDDPKGQELAAAQSTALVAEDSYADYVDAGNDGFGNTTKDDFAIPFLAVLQSNSPQCKPTENGGLPGAQQGYLFNTVTQDIYKGSVGIPIVFGTTEHCYIEWYKRDGGGQGGGFIARHELESDFVKQKKKEAADAQPGVRNPVIEWTDAEGKVRQLLETFYTYAVIENSNGGLEKIVIGWTSTKIKQYRSFMNRARGLQIKVNPKDESSKKVPAPLFSHRYRIHSFLDRNKKGEFFNFKVDFDGPDAPSCRISPSDPMFQEAFGLMNMIKTGAAQASYQTQDAAGEPEDDREDTSGDKRTAGQKADEKPPF